MSTERELLKKALDAIEVIIDTPSLADYNKIEYLREVIEAKLSEPEQDQRRNQACIDACKGIPTTELECAARSGSFLFAYEKLQKENQELKERLSEPEQEHISCQPLGYLVVNDVRYLYFSPDELEQAELELSEWGDDMTALYAHPEFYISPQNQKPLSDDEIMRACNATGGGTLIFKIARAIEKAHGIG